MGQILRVSAAMHILFQIEEKALPPNAISEEATKAAIKFVEVCCQHTAYIAGRGTIDNELELMQASEGPTHGTDKEAPQESVETLVLTLLGESLDVSFWAHKKRRFRNRGGIEGAFQAMKHLQEDGMGKLQPKRVKGTVKVCSSLQ